MSQHAQRSRFNEAERRGKEIFHIMPVILGGNPTDPANKALLSRQEHIKAVVYWNQIIRKIQRDRKGGLP